MTPLPLTEALLLAAAGGFITSMLNLFQDLERAPSKRQTRDWLFWVFFLFWPVVGAFLAYVYIRSGSTLNALSAVGTGVSAPALLQTLARNAPKLTHAARIDRD